MTDSLVRRLAKNSPNRQHAGAAVFRRNGEKEELQHLLDPGDRLILTRTGLSVSKKFEEEPANATAADRRYSRVS
jgi:hypothetical protein